MKKLSILICIASLTVLLAACNIYGEKVKKGHVETYYKDGITEAEALRAATMMYNIDVAANNPKIDKSFQLLKENNTIHFRMVVNKDRLNEVNDFNFLAISNYISDSVFNGAPVDIDLTDNTFKIIKTLPYKKMTMEDYQMAK